MANSNSAEVWARPGQKIKEAAEEGSTRETAHLAPISSLMFAELERRIDVVVFRSCFAHSIHAARQLVVHGKVRLNGIKVNVPTKALLNRMALTICNTFFNRRPTRTLG